MYISENPRGKLAKNPHNKATSQTAEMFPVAKLFLYENFPIL